MSSPSFDCRELRNFLTLFLKFVLCKKLWNKFFFHRVVFYCRDKAILKPILNLILSYPTIRFPEYRQLGLINVFNYTIYYHWFYHQASWLIAIHMKGDTLFCKFRTFSTSSDQVNILYLIILAKETYGKLLNGNRPVRVPHCMRAVRISAPRYLEN